MRTDPHNLTLALRALRNAFVQRGNEQVESPLTCEQIIELARKVVQCTITTGRESTMLCIHHVRNVSARTIEGANWVEITFSPDHRSTDLRPVTICIYAESHARHDGTVLIRALCDAINSIPKVGISSVNKQMANEIAKAPGQVQTMTLSSVGSQLYKETSDVLDKDKTV
jgi:hypothetical protein